MRARAVPSTNATTAKTEAKELNCRLRTVKKMLSLIPHHLKLAFPKTSWSATLELGKPLPLAEVLLLTMRPSWHAGVLIDGHLELTKIRMFFLEGMLLTSTFVYGNTIRPQIPPPFETRDLTRDHALFFLCMPKVAKHLQKYGYAVSAENSETKKALKNFIDSAIAISSHTHKEIATNIIRNVMSRKAGPKEIILRFYRAKESKITKLTSIYTTPKSRIIIRTYAVDTSAETPVAKPCVLDGATAEEIAEAIEKKLPPLIKEYFIGCATAHVAISYMLI